MGSQRAHDGGAEREREVLAHALGHDLRAPARTMHGLLGALSEVLGDQAPAESRDLLRLAESSAARLTVMIEALVEWLRSANGPAVTTEVDLNAIAAEAGELALRSHPKRAGDLRIDRLPSCVANRSGLVRVLAELLRNAFAASDGVALPEVRVYGESVDDADTGRVRIMVCDRGVGFVPSAADQLFRPFSTLHPRKDGERGAGSGIGIGLSIARRIVQSMDGTIEGASEGPGQGATFCVTLPARGR